MMPILAAVTLISNTVIIIVLSRSNMMVFKKKLLINYLLDCVLFPPKIMMAIVLQAWNGLTNKHSAACDGRL